MITKQKLEEANYIASEQLIRKVNASLTMKPLPVIALRGTAGTGKSFLAETVASVMDAQFLQWQAYRGATENDLFFKIIPSPDTKAGVKMEEGILTKACDLSQSHQVVILLDEWDKIRESADSALLTFLQTGRITVEGVRTEANLSNLVVFIGMNNERPYGEYFLRRVSVIDFKPLKTSVVREALKMTHPLHEQLEPALKLYDMSIKAGLEKPATIQELRQLLDAVTHLGEMADWDELVYQFVTKTPEAHEQLKYYSHDYQHSSIVEEEDEIEWDQTSFEEPEPSSISEEEEKEKEVWIPRPKIKNISFKSLKPQLPKDDEEKSFIISNEDDEGYTEIIKSLKPSPSDDPNRLGKFERLEGVIVSDQSLTLDEYLDLENIEMQFYLEDRVHLHDSFVDDVVIKKADKILHYTNSEIIAEKNNITVFFKKEEYGWYSLQASGESKNYNDILGRIRDYHPLKKFSKLSCESDEYQQKYDIARSYVNKYNLNFIFKIDKSSWNNTSFSFKSDKDQIEFSLPYNVSKHDNEYKEKQIITKQEYHNLAQWWIDHVDNDKECDKC